MTGYNELFGENEKNSTFHSFLEVTTHICYLPKRAFGFVSELDSEVKADMMIEWTNDGKVTKRR